MENFAPVQTALNQYNLLHPRFTVFVKHLQEQPDFQHPAVSWNTLDQNMIEFCFLNYHVRLHFEVVRMKGQLLGRIALEKASRGHEYRDLGRPVYFDTRDRAWLGQPGAQEVNIEDGVEAIAVYLFAPLVPQESGISGVSS